MTFNPLVVILKENKLVEPNYIDWERNLDIVLTAEEYKYVLTEIRDQTREILQPDLRAILQQAPSLPSRYTTHEEFKYVLVEVCPRKPDEGETDEESQAYQKWIKTNEMNLKEMLGDQNRAARRTAMKELINTTIVEGSPVTDHDLKMISLLNKLEILGAEIGGETQVDIIL
ncbi:uncharacterized protein LOC131153822 [Malania oleifera]|uniref:uncharacterized protein LOC131153822 n=1 Tax=Malania oleifera TaxID=397392 RepID=UPI0025ADFBF8|nr:uncharacterized protein LOC131153822 [Malania oleifera]